MDLELKPLSQDCSKAYEKREHICLGISPYNSLFSEEYISALISWSMKNFRSFHIFFPDEPTIYTLEALGYEGPKAQKKLKKQINWLRNKILKALAANGIEKEHAIDYVLDWQTLQKNSVFSEKLEEVFHLFETDEDFRKNCLEASYWVLENKIKREQITEEKLLKAVKYFLSEVPLFSSTNQIVNKETSVFYYHQYILFHEQLYNKQLKHLPTLGQGYAYLRQ